MLPKRSAQSLLFESAMELISYYPLQKVSVQDIAKHCNVSTRTFYNYFKDKHDLVEKSYVYLLENYFSSDYVCPGNKILLHHQIYTPDEMVHFFELSMPEILKPFSSPEF